MSSNWSVTKWASTHWWKASIGPRCSAAKMRSLMAFSSVRKVKVLFSKCSAKSPPMISDGYESMCCASNLVIIRRKTRNPFEHGMQPIHRTNICFSESLIRVKDHVKFTEYFGFMFSPGSYSAQSLAARRSRWQWFWMQMVRGKVETNVAAEKSLPWKSPKKYRCPISWWCGWAMGKGILFRFVEELGIRCLVNPPQKIWSNAIISEPKRFLRTQSSGEKCKMLIRAVPLAILSFTIAKAAGDKIPR